MRSRSNSHHGCQILQVWIGDWVGPDYSFGTRSSSYRMTSLKSPIDCLADLANHCRGIPTNPPRCFRGVPSTPRSGPPGQKRGAPSRFQDVCGRCAASDGAPSLPRIHPLMAGLSVCGGGSRDIRQCGKQVGDLEGFAKARSLGIFGWQCARGIAGKKDKRDISP